MTVSRATYRQVDILLAMYAAHKRLGAAQATHARQLAKARLKGAPTSQLQKEHENISQQMQQVADAMTFADPLIWALYKFEAYAKEAQPIRTMQDFRLHCSKPGYICTKRFTFVNQALHEHNTPSLTDAAIYGDEQPLTTAFAALHTLTQNGAFMQAWKSYEYYRQNGKAAKWENFTA